MANIFQKLLSKATFWDQNDDRQVAQQDEEERRRKNQLAVSASSIQRAPSFQQNNNSPLNQSGQFDFTKPLMKDNLKDNPIIGSQSQSTLDKPKPVAQPVVSDKQKELDRFAADELDQARKEQNDSEGWFGRNFLNKKAIEERAVSQARNRATTKFQDKYGWNADPEVLAYNKGTRARNDVETERLRKDAKSLDDFSKGMDKVGEVAGYVPITGSVLNLGLAGTEKLAKATGNDAYAADIGDQRLRLDVGMDQEQFDKLDPETQQKLRNLQGLGLALSPLDFLGVGGLAKSGVVAAGKKGAIQLAKEGAVDVATKQALKKALIAEGKSAIVPALVGAGASVGGQAYLGGTDNIDYLEAAKTGLLTAGASKILPFQSKNAAKGNLDIPQGADEIPVPTNIKGGASFNVEQALEKAGEDIDTPKIPGATTSDGNGTEIAPGLKSPEKTPIDVPKPEVRGPKLLEPLPEPNFPEIAKLEQIPVPNRQPQIPDVTNPIALAKAGDGLPPVTNVPTAQGAEAPQPTDLPGVQKENVTLYRGSNDVNTKQASPDRAVYHAETADYAETYGRVSSKQVNGGILTDDYQHSYANINDALRKATAKYLPSEKWVKLTGYEQSEIQSWLNHTLTGDRLSMQFRKPMPEVIKKAFNDMGIDYIRIPGERFRGTVGAVGHQTEIIEIPKPKPEVAQAKVEAPMADFSKSINVPLQKAPEATAVTPQVAPTTADLAEAAQAGDLRQSTKVDSEVDAQGNQALRSDAEVINDAIDSGIAPQRQASPVATSEEAMQLAAEKAANAEVDMAAPRTRAEAVNLVENDAARLDVADTFKEKDPVNIAETQAAATTAIRELDDAGLVSAFRAEPEIKTPQQFFETVAAVERLGRTDPSDPAAVRALTNALDGLSSFSSRAGRDLRMVKELFANLPPAMRKEYLVDRIESKLGVELPDNQRAELLGKITTADGTQTKINDVTARLEAAQKNIELGSPVDEAVVKADIDNLDKLTIVHEYQQGDAFQYSQDLLQSGTAGAKVAQATKTAMLSDPLRRTADVITTGITSASDTASNAISGLIGRALNKLPGRAGKLRETRAGDYGVLAAGNKEGFKDSLTSLRTDNRKVDDIMGELQKNTRSDANNAGRTRFGRFVGDMTEAATNATQGQRDQRLRELARQEGQKLGLGGDDLDLYTQITEKIPNEVQKHEASQYHLRTNNLHDNKLNTAFRSVASVIEKQFPQAGPIITALTVPFKSYTAGNLNRLFTDKTVLGNAFTLVQSARRGDTQGVVDALGKATVNTGETLVLGAILSQAGLLKDTNDNGEDWSGPYLQTPFGDIPVGFFGPTGINMIVGHNIEKFADSRDPDAFVNDFAKQALGFMNIEGSLGGNTPVQELISGQGDFGDRAVKAAGDTLRRPIPSFLGDINALGNTITGQDKPLTKATNEDGTTDYLKTEANRTIDKLGLGALLERDEGKSSQGILERITGGTRATDATNEAEGERDIQKSLKDLEKELKGAKVPLKEDEISDALDDGDYENAIKGLQYKVLKTENDPDATNSQIKSAKDDLLQAQLREQGVPVTEEGIKARTESGDFIEAIAGYQYQLQKLGDSEDVPESKKQTMRDEITRLQITAGGSYPASIIALYSDTSQSEWRAMGNPESEDYDPETYQLLYKYDSQLKDKGVSKSSKGGDKAKFSVGKGSGGGRGGSNKGFTTSIALQKFEGGDGGRQKYLSADFAEPKSAIPTLQKVANNDQSKKKKITVRKGGRT